MVPVRADESTASGIIHTDMFKALRDRRVVLAELSLHNPNVYYELGVEHVLSSAGTVLMCRADQPLPFDIALSRVVMYEYDGHHLDWEEAERVIPILRQYLLEALEGHQDSPVHALIHIPAADRRSDRTDTTSNPFLVPELHRYEMDLGERWRQDGSNLARLMTDHGRSTFGYQRSATTACPVIPCPRGRRWRPSALRRSPSMTSPTSCSRVLDLTSSISVADICTHLPIRRSTRTYPGPTMQSRWFTKRSTTPGSSLPPPMFSGRSNCLMATGVWPGSSSGGGSRP